MTPASIRHSVEKIHGMKPGALLVQTRRREIAWPRQMAMYIMRERLGMPYQLIARRLDMEDHSNILYGCRVFKKRAEKDARVMQAMKIAIELSRDTLDAQ